MKKMSPFFLLLPLSLGLLSCGEKKGDPSLKKVRLSYGRVYDAERGTPFLGSYGSLGDGAYGYSPYSSYAEVQKRITRGENFLLVIVHDEMCLCYQSWRDECLIPYVKKESANLLLLKEEELTATYVNEEGKEKKRDRFGIELGAYDSLCLFEKGKLAYQKFDAENTPFHDSYSAFSAWIAERSEKPTMFYIDSSDLDALYEGNNPFLVYYARGSCSDCAAFESEFLLPHLSETPLSQKAYLIDCDASGVRLDEEGKLAQEQWDAYKLSHGLAQADDNPQGYGQGYVPTVYFVEPDGKGTKVGSVIQGADVYRNDEYSVSEGNVTITSSYFTEERLERPELGYLKASSLKTKVLQGLSFSLPDESKGEYANYAQGIAPYHQAISKAFFDAYGQK